MLAEFFLNIRPGGGVGIVSHPGRCDTDWKRYLFEFRLTIIIFQMYGNEWEAVSNPFGVPAVEREVVLLDELKAGGGSAKPPWKDLMERVDNTKVALSLLQIFEA